MVEIYTIVDSYKNSETVIELLNPEKIGEIIPDNVEVTIRHIDQLNRKTHREVYSTLYRHGTDNIPFTIIKLNGTVIRAVYMEEIKDMSDYKEALLTKLNYVLALDTNED